ncbi:hypothetical protein BH11ACT1_BH11ACT1_22510 [soil metagenome]
MSYPSRRPPRPRRPTAARALAAAVVAVTLLATAGCDLTAGRPTVGQSQAPSPTTSPPASATPTAVPTRKTAPAVPEVPVQSAALGPVPRPTVGAPVRLTAAAQDIDLPVDPVGVAPDGQMQIPPRADRGGWYRFGAAPGDATGTAVITAHVDSVATGSLGPFAHLKDLVVGDTVEVTLADLSVHRYAVSSVARVAKPDVPWNDVFTRDGAPRLVLVTCGGQWQRDVRHYSDNVVVIADPTGA